MPKQFYSAETYRSRSSLGHLIRRAYSGMLARLEEAFADADVTMTQWIILVNLRDGHMRTAADICQRLSYDSGALTRVLDQLEHRSLIERRRSSGDRRVVELSLTDAGRDMVAGLLPLVIGVQNDLLENFTETEAAMLVSLLSKFVAQLELSPVSAGERKKEALTA